MRITAKGGEGTRLTLTRTSAAYDFTRAKKVATKGSDNGDDYTMTSVYKKRLAFKAALKGAKKGTLALKQKTAAGDGTVSSTFNRVSVGSTKLATYYRNGKADGLVPVRPSFTCTGRTLKLHAKSLDGVVTTVVDLTYRRI